MKKLLLIIIILVPMLGMAQQPKMHIRAFGGANTSTLVYKVEGLDADILTGWQAGAGFRIMHRRAFLEIDVVYLNYGLTVHPNDDADIVVLDPINIRMRALEFPLIMGYVPIKSPIFRWFLYGGFVNKFSIRGRYEYQGEKDSFSPHELQLHTYNLGARFGTQVDIAMFNFDFSYTIGITNVVKNKARTNMHSLQLSMGFIF